MPPSEPQPPPNPDPQRPAVVIISNAYTPYRLHLHRRIAAEIPQIKLHSLFTHETSNAPWQFGAGGEIGAVSFGRGESSDAQADPANAPREWTRAGKIIHWIKEQNVRFVVMMGYNDAGRVRIIRWCRKHALPCWLFGDSNILGDRVHGPKAILKRAIVGRILRWCDGALCCGTLGREYFIKYGVPPDRIFYFPYEPDYQLLAGLHAQAANDVRQQFNLAPDRKRIIFSGRLAPVKRPDLLIDAFAAIAGGRPHWDLLIVGDGPLKQSLQDQLPRDLASRVRWTGFLDDQTVVSALYRLSDVLVLPSDYEPWALVINEACAAGLAIVASNVVGAAAELVRDGVNGRLFPPGNLPALTECLVDITDETKIDARKAASAAVLADWRKRGDPVQGLRMALAKSGVLESM